MAASGVSSSSAAYVSTGPEQPISVSFTTVTTILSVPAASASASNRKKVLLLRCAAATGAGTPTLLLELVRANSDSVGAVAGTFVLRGNSALSAGEVYRETDILLMPGDTLRGTASTQVDVTGQYIDLGRGPGKGPAS